MLFYSSGFASQTNVKGSVILSKLEDTNKMHVFALLLFDILERNVT